MRELKFRLWNGFRMIDDEDLSENTSDLFIESGLSDQYENNICIPRVENLKVMQYTGLKDKNGKEIYEEDILDYGANTKFKVVFNKSSFKLQRLDFLNGNLHLLECCYLDELEVIGNIYENKNVLEK